ncbi:MAG: DUF2314 domain-containing protein [Myxococcota bacterium]
MHLSTLLLVSGLANAAPEPPPDARGAIAVYCANRCAELDASFAPQNRLPARARAPVLSVERWGSDFDLPTAEQIASLSNGDLSGLSEARDVALLSWAAPADQSQIAATRAMRAALSMGEWFEDLDSGLLLDESTLRDQLERVQGNHPDVTALIALDGAEIADGQFRLVTRGMAKLGLPDLIMDELNEDEINGAALVLNTTAQMLFERGYSTIGRLDGGAIRADAVRTLACGVTGDLVLKDAEPQPNDPLGPLATVSFSGTIQACVPSPEAPITLAAPPPEQSPPPVATPPSGAALEAAKSAAMSQLQGPIRQRFAAGLSPDEMLWVKAPFDGPQGRTEWMWVEVQQWRSDGLIIGPLTSTPRLSTDLKRGDVVAVDSSTVFDYLWKREDGTRAGNTTQALLDAPQ